MADGFIKLYRCLLGNPIICKDGDYFAVWCYLLLNATYKEREVLFKKEKITLKQGQLLTGRMSISGKLNISESKVQRILKTFENEAKINQEMGGDYEVILMVSKAQKQAVELFYSDMLDNDKPMVAKIDKKRKKRSLDANAYCFVLCDKIAQKIQTTKEKIYQESIREVGVFDNLLLQDKAVESFINMWNKKGLGDFAEITHKSKAVQGCTAVIAYHGSSVYDTKQMSILIDYIVNQAKDLGVETMTPVELEILKNNWKDR